LFIGEFGRYVKQNLWINNTIYRGCAGEIVEAFVNRGIETQ